MTKLFIFFSSIHLFAVSANIDFSDIEKRKKQEWQTISKAKFTATIDSQRSNQENQEESDYIEDSLSLGQAGIVKKNLNEKNINDSSAQSEPMQRKKVQFEQLHQKYFPEETEYK